MVPPDPMPNSAVKRRSADGSVGSPHARVGNCQASNCDKPSVKTEGFFTSIIPPFTSSFCPTGPMLTRNARQRITPAGQNATKQAGERTEGVELAVVFPANRVPPGVLDRPRSRCVTRAKAAVKTAAFAHQTGVHPHPLHHKAKAADR